MHHYTCADSSIRKYRQRISGPLLDRIDIHMDVPRVDYDKLTSVPTGEASAQIRERVEYARQIQRERFQESSHLQANADMGAKEVDRFCETTPEAADLLKMSLVQMQLSARAYHRILKLARTIADLDDSEIIDVKHLAEAIQYRPRRLTG